MEFAPVEQLPLDLFAGLQTDGHSQTEGKAHIESGILPFGADGLHPQRIGEGHFFLHQSVVFAGHP